MKYLKTFENTFNYEVGIFTNDEASELYRKFLDKHNYEYDLKSKIHYFSHFSTWSSSENYDKTSRFIIAYNDIDIIGICHFANYASNDHWSISYCSTNKDYFQKGISKRLLEECFKYFSEHIPNETLHFSGYSVEGWKYFRKYILEFAKKYNVKIEEQGVGYPGPTGKQGDDFYDLVRTSNAEVEKLYGKRY